MHIRQFGSIYEAGQAKEPGFECGDQDTFHLGDTVPGKEIQWVELSGGLLVADRCVCTGISWATLNKAGYIFGRIVHIDGKDYICRSLKLGARGGMLNEWDDALDECGVDDDLWHWKQHFFFGQEISKKNAVAFCVVRGGMQSSRDRFKIYAGGAGKNKGFRPVLEPLCSDAPEILVGSNIKAFGPAGESFEGRLADFDSYDLVLTCDSIVPRSCAWAKRKGKAVILARDSVIGIRKIL